VQISPETKPRHVISSQTYAALMQDLHCIITGLHVFVRHARLRVAVMFASEQHQHMAHLAALAADAAALKMAST
jgi:hypothetical protein